MCKIHERVYVEADGRERVSEETTRCSKAHHKKLCSNVKRTVHRYVNPPPISRDDAPSPASNNPPTPPAGTYLVQERRPSGTDRRPSPKEKRISNIIISIGSSSKKDKDKKYPSAKNYKRSSLNSVESNEIAIESVGSDASYPMQSGVPYTTIVSDNHPGYNTRPAVPRGHRHTASGSSLASNNAPSRSVAADPDSPSTRQRPRYPPTLVHNPPSEYRSSNTTPPSPYRTTIAVPAGSSPRSTTATYGQASVNPFDYQDTPEPSVVGSSQGIRGAYVQPPQQPPQAPATFKRRQEEADREMAARIQEDERRAAAKQEERKSVHFDIDPSVARDKARAAARAEGRFAQSEKDRADGREEIRRRKKEKMDQEERERAEQLKIEEAKRRDALREEAKIREREKRDSRPPASGSTKRHVRRPSISQAEIAERDRLLAHEDLVIQHERIVADQQEKDERAAALLQQQQQAGYYNPRGANVVITNEGAGVGRRNSVSGRRPSISNAPPPAALGRSNSQRRASVVIQNAPPGGLPPLNTNLPNLATTYNSRPPSSSRQNPPAFFQPSHSKQSYSRPPSARTSSYSQDNPFAQPPGRLSNTSIDNPYAKTPSQVSGDNPFVPNPSTRHATQPLDTYDTRTAQPSIHTRQISDDRPPTLRRRGEEVLDRAAAGVGNSRQERARQASRRMSQAVDYNDYAVSSEEDVDRLAGYASRMGLGGKGGVAGKRRN